MTFYKVLKHDINCGLFRYRYLFIPIFVFFPIIEFYWNISFHHISFSWMDLFVYLFRGSEILYISAFTTEQVPLPIHWLFIIGCCLILNLNYAMSDLSQNGQQIIIRCKNRKIWFLSKCVWNFASSTEYIALLLLSTLVATYIMGGTMSLSTSNDVLTKVLLLSEACSISGIQAIFLVIILPFLNIATLNILQMTLCLFIKPVASFLICFGILIISIYQYSYWIPGTTAMMLRVLANSSITNLITALSMCGIIIAFCLLIGTARFLHMDILFKED